MSRYIFKATDFLPWRCPECKRVLLIRSDAIGVECVGGWIMLEPVSIPWHETAECYRIPEYETDPIALLKGMGLWNNSQVNNRN